jgi:hypothetical protein
LPPIPELDVKQEMACLQGRLSKPTLVEIFEVSENRVQPKMMRYLSVLNLDDYSAISVEELVKRGVNRLKPASSTGEQLRDVMLWLVTLSYAKKKADEIGFITSDGDFFESNDLHPQLRDELTREGVKIRVARSIEDFLKVGSPSQSIGKTWIQKYVGVEETKKIELIFEKAIASYLDSGWRSRSEVTSLGETTWTFKNGTLYSLAPDSHYAELEYDGTAMFAIGPHVFTHAPPFNSKDYALEDVQVNANFVISAWVIAEKITSFELEKMIIRSVSNLGPHKV